MKIGDRVRIARGEHEGRIGTIVDTKDKLEALDRVLRSSPTRELLKSKLQVPDGCQAVALDVPLDPLGLTVERVEVFSVSLLIPVEPWERQPIRVIREPQ